MTRLILAAMLLAAYPQSAPAQAGSTGAEKGRSAWAALSPERRERVLRNYKRYQALSAPERRRIQERFKLFQSLPRDRREELIRRWRLFQALPAEKQNQTRLRLERSPGARSREGGGLGGGEGRSFPEERGARAHGGGPFRGR